MSDSCGRRGHIRTNPTAAVISDYLLIAVYPNWRSTCPDENHDHPLVGASFGTLHPADFACPTWGLSDPFQTTCNGSVFVTQTVGPPFNPVIIAATEVLSLDPVWAACTEIYNSVEPRDDPLAFMYGVYDPPKVLFPAKALTPLDTTSTTPVDPVKSTAAPESVVSQNIPKPTMKIINSATAAVKSNDNIQLQLRMNIPGQIQSKNYILAHMQAKL